MTEQGDGTKVVSFPSSWQSETPSGNVQQAGNETPQYLTREDALKLIAEVEERTTRKLQSIFDKSSHTLQKKIHCIFPSLTVMFTNVKFKSLKFYFSHQK